MLPIVDKPLIQYAVEEAYAAGIRQMIFVTGRSKRAVEDHFDTAYELEVELERCHKHQLLSVVQSIKPDDMQCLYVRQPRAIGLGHAVLCAEHIVGDGPFAVLLADDLMVGSPSVLTQMIEQFMHYQSSIIAVEEIPRHETNRYGIVVGTLVGDRLTKLNHIIEKPAPKDAPTTTAVAGRYILTPSIFHDLKKQECGLGGEMQLTDAIESLLQRESVFAYQFDGIRYDCGSKIGFLRATVDLAERHQEVGRDFAAWLETR